MIDNVKNILGSPRFWAALLAIVFVLLGAYAPKAIANLDQVALTAAVTALILFIASESVAEPPTGLGIFGKVRFWALVVSLAFVFIKAFMPAFPLTEAMIQALVSTLGVAAFGMTYRAIGAPKPS
jgi:hypothetical protein